MNETTQHLAVAFGTLGGVLLLLLAFGFSRFWITSRQQRRLRQMGQLPSATPNDEKDAWARTHFGGLLKPGVGPGGTRTFLNGIFGLDAPPRSAPLPPGSTSGNSPRESNFSSASRRSARSRRQATAAAGGGAVEAGEAPAARADELGMKQLTLVETADPFRSESQLGLSRASADSQRRWVDGEDEIGVASDEDERGRGEGVNR